MNKPTDKTQQSLLSVAERHQLEDAVIRGEALTPEQQAMLDEAQAHESDTARGALAPMDPPAAGEPPVADPEQAADPEGDTTGGEDPDLDEDQPPGAGAAPDPGEGATAPAPGDGAAAPSSPRRPVARIPAGQVYAPDTPTVPPQARPKGSAGGGSQGAGEAAGGQDPMTRVVQLLEKIVTNQEQMLTLMRSGSGGSMTLGSVDDDGGSSQ